MEAREVAQVAARALDAKKGIDIMILKVDEMTVITDYMVIATGRSVPQVKALAESVEEELAKREIFAKRTEGLSGGHWGILDYGDVVVHVFHEKDREYYQLERLWAKGTNEIPMETPAETEQTEA